jgi:hypothetical protein
MGTTPVYRQGDASVTPALLAGKRGIAGAGGQPKETHESKGFLAVFDGIRPNSGCKSEPVTFPAGIVAVEDQGPSTDSPPEPARKPTSANRLRIYHLRSTYLVPI